MTPGTIFFDKSFKFLDGKEGRKLAISLGADQGINIVVKTTSNGKRYNRKQGCNLTSRFPCFYLPNNTCCLSKPTWICLDEFYDFNNAELMQKRFSGELNIIGTLQNKTLRSLLTCCIDCEDITRKQSEILRRQFASM